MWDIVENITVLFSEFTKRKNSNEEIGKCWKPGKIIWSIDNGKSMLKFTREHEFSDEMKF
jgi:hypothetical protein